MQTSNSQFFKPVPTEQKLIVQPKQDEKLDQQLLERAKKILSNDPQKQQLIDLIDEAIKIHSFQTLQFLAEKKDYAELVMLRVMQENNSTLARRLFSTNSLRNISLSLENRKKIQDFYVCNQLLLLNNSYLRTYFDSGIDFTKDLKTCHQEKDQITLKLLTVYQALYAPNVFGKNRFNRYFNVWDDTPGNLRRKAIAVLKLRGKGVTKSAAADKLYDQILTDLQHPNSYLKWDADGLLDLSLRCSSNEFSEINPKGTLFTTLFFIGVIALRYIRNWNSIQAHSCISGNKLYITPSYLFHSFTSCNRISPAIKDSIYLDGDKKLTSFETKQMQSTLIDIGLPSPIVSLITSYEPISNRLYEPQFRDQDYNQKIENELLHNVIAIKQLVKEKLPDQEIKIDASELQLQKQEASMILKSIILEKRAAHTQEDKLGTKVLDKILDYEIIDAFWQAESLDGVARISITTIMERLIIEVIKRGSAHTLNYLLTTCGYSVSDIARIYIQNPNFFHSLSSFHPPDYNFPAYLLISNPLLFCFLTENFHEQTIPFLTSEYYVPLSNLKINQITSKEIISLLQFALIIDSHTDLLLLLLSLGESPNFINGANENCTFYLNFVRNYAKNGEIRAHSFVTRGFWGFKLLLQASTVQQIRQGNQPDTAWVDCELKYFKDRQDCIIAKSLSAYKFLFSKNRYGQTYWGIYSEMWNKMSLDVGRKFVIFLETEENNSTVNNPKAKPNWFQNMINDLCHCSNNYSEPKTLLIYLIRKCEYENVHKSAHTFLAKLFFVGCKVLEAYLYPTPQLESKPEPKVSMSLRR